MSAQIIFHRPTAWTDRMRAYKLYVNDEERGRIKRATSVTIDVPAGMHSITAEIDWCSSNTVEVQLNDGDVAEIDVTNPHGPWRAAKVTRQAPGGYLELRVR